MSNLNPRFVALVVGVGLIAGGVFGLTTGLISAGVVCLIGVVAHD